MRTVERGLVAEYGDEEGLVAAIRALRRAGYRRLDALTPYPSNEVCSALELPRSKIPWVTGTFGFLGAGIGYWILWWTQVVDYPLDVGGRTPHAWPAYIPITFESGVMLGGVATFFAFFLACGLPRLWHPLFEVAGIERASVDGYFLVIDAEDDRFSERTHSEVEETDPARVERFGFRVPEGGADPVTPGAEEER